MTPTVFINKCYFCLADEDAPFTEGVWSIILCVLAGASYLWWHCSLNSSDTDVDTYTSLSAAFTVSSPCYGLLSDCSPPVHTCWDTVLISHVIYVQCMGCLPASFAKCVHLCKYDDNQWLFIVKPHSKMATIVSHGRSWFQLFFSIIDCHVCIPNGAL